MISLELEKIEDDAIIGSGVYGECKTKTYKRLGINVVEKELKGGDIDFGKVNTRNMKDTMTI